MASLPVMRAVFSVPFFGSTVGAVVVAIQVLPSKIIRPPPSGRLVADQRPALQQNTDF
jgi:hypothetical protein